MSASFTINGGMQEKRGGNASGALVIEDDFLWISPGTTFGCQKRLSAEARKCLRTAPLSAARAGVLRSFISLQTQHGSMHRNNILSGLTHAQHKSSRLLFLH